MVRDQVYRRAKYAAKVDPDVVKARIGALKETMTEQTDALFAELAALETSVKQEILEPAGVKSIMIPMYLNVARQLYKLTKKFSAQTLQAEAHTVVDKWYERGLQGTILNALLAKFGIPEKTFPAGGGGT